MSLHQRRRLGFNHAQQDALCFTVTGDPGSSVAIRLKMNNGGAPAFFSSLEKSANGYQWKNVGVSSGQTRDITIGVGERCYLRNNDATSYGTGTSTAVSNWAYFVCTVSPEGAECYVDVSGRLDSLVGGEHKSTSGYAFYAMFSNFSSLRSAGGLILPDPRGRQDYFKLFSDCTGLIEMPEIPSDFHGNSGVFRSAFAGCLSLEQAKELRATPTAQCYYNMFNGSGLRRSPVINARTVANSAFNTMFSNCPDIETVAELPATELVYSCYSYMYASCPKIMLSETQTDFFTKAFRIPPTGTSSVDAAHSMFANTGGTFTGTPLLGKTYYLHVPEVI